MYTGIIEQMGTISALIDSAEGRRLTITPINSIEDLKLGDSINISGCCFTVVEFAGNSFIVQASHETLRRTKIGNLLLEDRVNLERPVKLNDRLGGHLVAGHVDCTAKIISIQTEGFSKLVAFTLPIEYAPFFVEKGSVTIDGVSLTIVDCFLKASDNQLQFSVALIPHTMEITTLGDLQIGQTVNIETDLISKYLARWLSLGSQIDMTKIFASINSQTSALKKEQVYS